MFKNKIIIISILIIGFLLRLSLILIYNRIEADSMVYITLANAIYNGNISQQLISSTQTLPMLYPAMLSIAHYISIPVAIFGQMLSLIFGTLSIFISYIITFKVTKDKRVALFASFFVSISPLLVLSSSIPMRDTPALFFGLLTFFFMLRSIQEKRIIHWLLTGFFIAITVMIRLEYLEMLVVIPIFIFLSLILEKKDKIKRVKKYFLGYLLIMLAFIITAYFIQEYFYLSKGFALNIFNFSSFNGLIDIPVKTSHINNISIPFYVKYISINNLMNFVSAICFFTLHVSLILCIISLIKNCKNIMNKRSYTLLVITLFVTLSVRYMNYNAWGILIGRYCLLMVVIISIFAGDALNSISKFINRFINIKKRIVIYKIIIIVLLIIITLSAYPLIFKKWDCSWEKEIKNIRGNKSKTCSIITNYPDSRLGYYGNGGLYMFLLQDFSLNGSYKFVNCDFGTWNRSINLPHLKFAPSAKDFYKNIEKLKGDVYLIFYGFSEEDLRVVFESQNLKFNFTLLKQIKNNDIDIGFYKLKSQYSKM